MDPKWNPPNRDQERRRDRNWDRRGNEYRERRVDVHQNEEIYFYARLERNQDGRRHREENVWRQCSDEELEKHKKELDRKRFGYKREVSTSASGGPVMQVDQDPLNYEAMINN